MVDELNSCILSGIVESDSGGSKITSYDRRLWKKIEDDPSRLEYIQTSQGGYKINRVKRE